MVTTTSMATETTENEISASVESDNPISIAPHFSTTTSGSKRNATAAAKGVGGGKENSEGIPTPKRTNICDMSPFHREILKINLYEIVD
jgi:hypothetical protein